MTESSGGSNWKKCMQALGKTVTDLSALKRELEIINEAEIPEFLLAFMPWALSQLASAGLEKSASVREAVLDTFTLLPGLGESLKPYLTEVMNALIKVITEDGETIALAAMHVFMELHKVFRGAVEASVQPFIDFVLKLLESFPGMVQKSSVTPMSSVKLIIECPVMVVLLFQLHRKFINDNILKFVPLIMKILEISLDPPAFVSEMGKAVDDLAVLGSAEHGRNRARQQYCDFIQAKVKVLSYLAYVSRSFSSALKAHQSAIPHFIVDILRNCPPESASARKELLVAVRHILATELRGAFISEFETLLDDELLFGVGYTAGSVMRPLVYSTIADLVHHIRLDLSAETILRVIDIYARCFHDPSLPYGIQTMSAKLLLNLMDCVNGEKMDPQMRRPVTMKILTILLCKYRRLARIVEEVNKRRFGQSEEFNRGFDVYWDDPDHERLINSDLISADSNRDIVRDIKFILKTITAGVKSIILSFKTNYISFNPNNPNEPQPSADPSTSFAGSCNFSLAESKLFIDFFRDGVACFDICQVESNSSSSSSSSAPAATPNSTSISAEDKDLVDQFAYIFTLLDPYIFQDVLSAHLEYLFGKIVKNPLLLIIPQYFLAINTVSRNFSGILIRFLMDKFEMVGESSIQGSSLLRLFKLVFLAVSVYPDENEQMILPYISDIILNCLRLSSQSANPLNYFLLLKALFRGIAGGRFEHLYKEVLPILPLLLETLNRLATAATDKQMRDLYVELCLTTPVRLSVLLPYLPLLMKPLVLALTSETELVSQGLRTLELCVDNLTQDFLEPILAPVLPSLLAALWSLLRTGSSSTGSTNYGQYAMKILGKFGGRGRRFMKYPLKLETDGVDACLSLVFSGANSMDDSAAIADTSLQLSIDCVIELISDYFAAPQSRAFEGYTATDLFSLLLGCLSALSGFDVREDCSIEPTLLSASAFIPDSSSASATSCAFDEESVLKRLKTASSNLSNASMMTELDASKTATCFTNLCKALFQATLHADGSIATQARISLNNLCDRFVVIQLLAQRNSAKDYSFAGMTPNAFLEVVAGEIASSQAQLTDLALTLLQRIHSQLITYVPVERIAEFPLFFLLVERLIAFCYDAPFHAKLGACQGLKMLCGFGLGVRWMWVQESRILRGLLYILKDMPPYCTEAQKEEVGGVLLMVLRLCHEPRQLNSLLEGLSTEAAVNDARGKDQYYFNQIMSILISELTSPNVSIRRVVHASFTLLAECHSCQVAELLTPHRDRLLLPIFTKPLRALPFTLQIGYVDAVNYCLSLKPPLVNFSEELLRLLHEALALVEADDTALASKTGQLKNATNLVNLRVVCISLLSTAISAAEFQDPKLHQIRNHIVSAFFKSLYSKAPEIVAVARSGLEQVILHQQKLPKDLLQHGLRPVLINLAEAKRLTLAGLEGLSKVLQLLTSYFKAEIGKKLLDHVGVWAEQKMLEDLAGKPLLESMEVRVIVAILDVFHLLPPSANLFLEELVLTVQKLDSWTRRTRSSPFRPPLFKFLYKHPQDALQYLLTSNNTGFIDLFECAIEYAPSNTLIAELNSSSNLQLFISKFMKDSGVGVSAGKILLAALKETGQSFAASDQLQAFLLAALKETPRDDAYAEVLLELLFTFLSDDFSSSSAAELLFALFEGMSHASAGVGFDSSWIPRGMRDLIAGMLEKGSGGLQVVKALLSAAIDYDGEDEAIKARVIRFFLLPLLNGMKKLHQPLSGLKIDKAILERDVNESLEANCNTLALEELQLASSLIACASSANELKPLLLPLRRLLVVRGASADPVIRYAALVGACQFVTNPSSGLSGSGADVRLIDAIMRAALNVPTSEVKPLLRQMLSFCLPFLLENAQPDFLHSWLPSILTDLARSPHFLTVIAVFWSNFVGAGGEEQEWSEQLQAALVRPLISSLSRAALSVLSVAENRQIPFEVAKMLLKWLASGRVTLEAAYYDQLLHTLIKMALMFVDGPTASGDVKALSSTGLSLLKDISALTQPQHPLKPRYEYFIRSLPPLIDVSDDAISSSCAFVKIFLTLSADRSDELFVADCAGMQRFLHFCLTCLQERLVSEVLPVLARLLPLAEGRFDELVGAITQFLGESLQSARGLDCSIRILQVFLDAQSPISESLQASFLRAFQKLGRDHLGATTAGESDEPGQIKAVLIPALKVATDLFCSADNVTPTKGITYSFLKMLWEQTGSAEVCRFLLGVLKGWFEESVVAEGVDLKERTDLVACPSRLFEIADEALIEEYLELVLQIYSSPRLRATDLTVRLEGSFLYGLCQGNRQLRGKFFSLIDELIPKKLDVRLLFIFASQRWNLVVGSYWLSFAVEFLLAAWPRPVHSLQCLKWPQFLTAEMHPGALELMFTQLIPQLFKVLAELLHSSRESCHAFWLQLFPQLWSSLSGSVKDELTESLCKIMSDSEFTASALDRPNVIKTLLDALVALNNPPEISAHLISYLGTTFGAWHSAALYLEGLEKRGSPSLNGQGSNSSNPSSSSSSSSASNNPNPNHGHNKAPDFASIKDLCQVYGQLGEHEMMAGLMRRYAIFPETNLSLSFEQNSQWITAQKIYEKAQIKARNGTIPFFEDEFSVWEAHWERCAKKLQQWDLLAEVAKVDGNTNLALECEWVLNDWSRSETKHHIEGLLGQVREDTHQKRLMEAFLSLTQLKDSATPEKLSAFQSAYDAVVQDLLGKWSALPELPSPAHAAALERIQIMVELQESQNFFANAAQSAHRPQFLQELKGLLSTWRDRLPNAWEDTGVWSGLLAWRQHVFTAINASFHNGATGAGATSTTGLTGSTNATTGPSTGEVGGNPAHPFAFRGYHETAWLINRFAHVARKNGLFDVSLSFLNKIYTLPNIEIQDAFLKLREQAKCYMESPSELPTALEVINATNLNYFNNAQKAEFFTLKAIVLSRLGMIDEANRIFAQAVQIDLNIAKGWSAWGYFNDQRFQQSKDITFGVNAVNCYLQAATLCKNASARKYLTRVLWLLTFEDASGSMSKSFELYNHDLPAWSWVPFIPELLTSLNRREARQARFLLMKIAKSYPQALYLPLRTANEEFKLLNPGRGGAETPSTPVVSSSSSSSNGAGSTAGNVSPNVADNLESFGAAGDDAASSASTEFQRKPPHELAEDLIGILKTGYPLLALSLENMVEHIIHRLRSSPEEDLYRIITTLITENLQQTMIKLNANLSDSSPSPMAVIEASLKKVAEMLAGSAYLSQKFKASFEADFLSGVCGAENGLGEILDKLLRWKQHLGAILDKLPCKFHLENFSRYLAEFEHQRYDEIEIPGQYLALRDASTDFVKLDRFESQVEIVRRHGTAFRRIVMIGSDGSRKAFIIQNPSSRQSRREERMVQLMRMADAIVDKKIISRRHGLGFHVQNIIPLSAFVRLIEDPQSFCSLEDVYEWHCKQVGMRAEDPILYFRDSMYKGIESLQIPFKKGSVDLLNLRVDLFEEVCRKFVPADCLTRFIQAEQQDACAYWSFRRRFTAQYAAFTFISYALAIGHRFPYKIGFSRDTVDLLSYDLLPALNASGQLTLTEAVPFRMTPNLQHFLTEVGIEGPFASYLMALGQALSGKKQDLADYLSLYVRDELLAWLATPAGSAMAASMLPNGTLDDAISMQSEVAAKIIQNVEIVMKRVQSMACHRESEKGVEVTQPLDQIVLDLISCAVNPQKLAHMDSHWHPWF